MEFNSRVFKHAVVGLGLGVAIAGCGAQAAPPPLATVNGHAITNQEWKIAVGATSVLSGSAVPTTATAKKSEIQALVQQEIVAQWALSHHVTTLAKADAAAKTYIQQQILKATGGASQFKAALAKYHLTQAQFTSYLTRQMVLQSAFNKETAKAPAISTTAAQSYYQKNTKQFVTPPQVEVRHILVKTKAQAQSILSQVQHGANFAALARRDSLDKSTAASGGSLGWVQMGAASGLVPHFYAEMDKLKPGQYGIAHTRYGYHVIEVEAKKPGGQVAFQKVSSEIKAQLLQNEKTAMFQKWASQIGKTAKVKVF